MRSRRAAAAVLLLLVTGCRPSEREARPAERERGEPTRSPEKLSGSTSDQLFRVEVVPEKGRIPLNEHVAVDVTVRRADGGAVPDGLSVSVDADMPTHRHGINVRPSVTAAAGPGRFRVEGLLLHMPGDWELYVDVTPPGSAGASRATFRLRLE